LDRKFFVSGYFGLFSAQFFRKFVQKRGCLLNEIIRLRDQKSLPFSKLEVEYSIGWQFYFKPRLYESI
jgi:hypothetical protein